MILGCLVARSQIGWCQLKQKYPFEEFFFSGRNQFVCWSWILIFHHNLQRSQQSSNMIIMRAAWILIMILTDFACNFNYRTVPSSLFNHIISGSSRIFHAFVVGCLDFKGHTCRFQRNPLNVFFSLSWSSHSFFQISGYPGHWRILFGKLHPWVSPFASSSDEHRFGCHQSEVQIFEGSQESQILDWWIWESQSDAAGG